MPTVGELNEKHAALLAKVRELRDANKDKEMPAEKAALPLFSRLWPTVNR